MAVPLAAPLGMFSEHDGLLEITQISGDDACARRLSALGFFAGKRIKVVRQGDPAILSVGSSRFALAGELQDRIFACPVLLEQ